MPAGKSGHLELGYMIGNGKPCIIYFEKEPDRWDVMTQFAFLNTGDICTSMDNLKESLKRIGTDKFGMSFLSDEAKEIVEKLEKK